MPIKLPVVHEPAQGSNHVRKVSGTAIPYHGSKIDTDVIIPARFLKMIDVARFGLHAFNDDRLDDDGKPKPDHPFNDSKYDGASILFVNDAFGSGSSREHAVWALRNNGITEEQLEAIDKEEHVDFSSFGIQAIVGESFAAIFESNCLANGIPAVTVPKDVVEKLMKVVEDNPETQFDLDVASKTLTYNGETVDVDISEGRKNSLLNGSWDTLGVLYANADKVRETLAKVPHFWDEIA